MTKPFEGLRVVDLSDRLSGAFAARLFGDFGADVVLVESPDGHPLRHEPPFLRDEPGTERSVLHAYVNWNKRSVVADDAEERARLVGEADVIVTTSPDLDFEPLRSVLAERRTDSVHLSITAHGLNNPLSHYAGNNLTASARTGWAYVNGYRDEPPLQMPRQQNGYVGGVAGYVAAAAALLRRNEGAEGELVDLGEIEAMALTVHPWAIGAVYQGIGASRGPAGGRLRGDPGPLWQTADGQINLGLGDWHNWPDAMKLINLPEQGTREDLIPDMGRHSKDMTAVVAGAAREVASMQKWPLFHALSKIRCQCGCLQDIEEIVHDEQLGARGFRVETHIEDTPVRAAGPPAKLSPAPWELSVRAPKLNEHVGQLGIQAPRTDPSRASDAKRPSPEGPLTGVRVLAFTQAWSGTFGTELLSLLGADVVQIEALHRVDVWRRTGAAIPKGVQDPDRRQHRFNAQGLYNSVNLNKRGITLDLRQERGWEIFWDLVPHFDIVAENFRPTVLPRWGVSLEKLAEKRPDIILASISGYGTNGPYASYPANGATTEPMSGFSSIHGYAGDPGMNSGGLYPDPIAGYFFGAMVLAALHRRNRSGGPQRIDLSMMEAMGIVCGDAVAEYDATGRIPRPAGNQHPRIAPHNIYEAKGHEWLALSTDTEPAWRAVATHIGGPQLADDPRFITMSARKANEAALDEIISEWCAGQDVFETEVVLGALGAAVARVAPPYELYGKPDARFTERGFIVPIDHQEIGVTMLPGRPWRFSSGQSAPLRPSPCVGEHSLEVFRDELGIEGKDYDDLVAQGITGTLYD